MIRQLIFYFFISASLCSSAQSQARFFKTLKTNGVESGHSIVKGFYKNYYVAGTIAKGGEDFFIANYDLNGNLIWSKDYGSLLTEQGDGVFLENTYDGGILLGGYRHNKNEIAALKLDQNGQIVYSTNVRYGSVRKSIATSAKVFEDGKSIIAGYSFKSDALTSTYQLLLKLDKNGNVVWAKDAKVSGWGYFCWDVHTDNNEILTSGYCTDSTRENIYLNRNDSEGNNIWTYRYEGTGKDRLNKIIHDFGCGYVGVGTTSDPMGNKDILFVKFDHDGNILHSKKIGGSRMDRGSHIVKTYDGNYVIGGTSNSFSTDNSSNIFLMKMDSVGQILWVKSYGDSLGQSSIENTAMFVQSADSGFVMTGNDSKLISGKDFLLMKTDRNGDMLCHSSSSTASSVNYTLSKTTVQIDSVMLNRTNSSVGLNVSKSLFIEDSICSSLPSSSCGLIANFDFLQNCGSNTIYFFDRSYSLNSNYSISVSFGDGNSFSGNQNTGFFTHQYSTTGFYTINLNISTNNCNSSISKTLYAFNPLGNFDQEIIFCEGDSIDLSLPFNNFTEYIWRDSDKNIISTNNNLKVSPTDSSMYYISATDLRNCCTIHDSVLLIPKGSQQFSIGNDTMICIGDTIKLELAGEFNTVVEWQDGSKDTSFTVTDTGLYHVSVMTNCGLKRDSVYISDARQLADVISDSLICNANSYIIHAGHADILDYKWGDGSTADSLLVDTTGKYFITVTDAYCTYSDSSNVELYDIALASLPDTFYLCPGISDSLNVSTPFSTYLWSNGSSNPSIEVNSVGVVWVQISNPCSTYTLNTYVKNFESNLDIVNDTLVCDLDTITLSANFPNAEILWSTGDTASSIKVFEDGRYSVRIDFSNSCSISDTAVVEFLKSPLELLADTEYICVGNSIVLDVNTDGGSYVWNTGETTASIQVSTTGLYTVQISNACGYLIDSVAVRNTTFKNILKDTLVCDLDSFLLDVSDMNADKYLWSNGEILPFTYAKQSGIYYVDVFFGSCMKRDSMQVTFTATPDVFLGEDTSVCQSLILDATSDQAVYTWQDNSTNPQLEVRKKGTYFVSVTNFCGSSQDTIFVEIKDCEIKVPNIFTPNADGINDEFLISSGYGIWKVDVFNRWGNLVYHSEDVSKSSWDGRDYSGKKCSDGIYFVVLKRTDFHESINSTVMLLR